MSAEQPASRAIQTENKQLDQGETKTVGMGEATEDVVFSYWWTDPETGTQYIPGDKATIRVSVAEGLRAAGALPRADA